MEIERTGPGRPRAYVDGLEKRAVIFLEVGARIESPDGRTE